MAIFIVAESSLKISHMKKYRPTTPSRRHMTTIEYRKVLSGHRAKKSLKGGFRRGSGRNAFGRITMRHHGGGGKRSFRLIDFKMNKFNVPGKVKTIEYDPNRTGFIALVSYKDGEYRYILAPKTV